MGTYFDIDSRVGDYANEARICVRHARRCEDEAIALIDIAHRQPDPPAYERGAVRCQADADMEWAHAAIYMVRAFLGRGGAQ